MRDEFHYISLFLFFFSSCFQNGKVKKATSFRVLYFLFVFILRGIFLYVCSIFVLFSLMLCFLWLLLWFVMVSLLWFVLFYPFMV